ncbi:GNAT family N-acetyltransferase [Faecalispora anaeroviscerum]|uniref:GNAT family N-acetyltransferase n=1 Tax=Faecalispora anaeroviscerum TaxID=2991836 RepID=UPI0024B8E0F8|nr:GNAT family N-acetyltransferase [Faecalispora anaeroviscerum]
MEKVTIREVRRDDLEAIRELYYQPAFHDGEPIPMEQTERILEEMEQYPYYKVFVALIGDRVVGTFSLAILQSLSGDFAGVIEDVVVREECRGQGIGEQMIRFALERGKEAGCYKVALSSNVKRERAHHFYESLGFERHGYSFTANL